MKKLFISLLMSICLLLPLTLNAFTLNSNEGDIVVWILPPQTPSSEFYEGEQMLRAVRNELTAIHAYVPYYGSDFNSWDGRSYPLGYIGYCHHIEALPANYNVPAYASDNHFRLVLLKPTNIVPWSVGPLRNNVNWFINYSSGYYIADQELHDYYNGVISKKEFLPMKAPGQSFWDYVTLNSTNYNFWLRYQNCSTSLAWGITYTSFEDMNSNEQIDFYNYMAGHDGYTAQDMVMSNDLMSPGALADCLVSWGYYYVYQIYSF